MALLSNDVIYYIMDRCITFDAFMHMRMVCRRFNMLSIRCSRQWYMWLKWNGPIEKWCYYNHKPCPCDDETNCKLKHHFWDRTRIPRVLKTVPLHIQVFQIATRRRERRMKRYVQYANNNLHNYEVAMKVWQKSLTQAHARLCVSEEDSEEVQQMRRNYKRVRVHISNDIRK